MRKVAGTLLGKAVAQVVMARGKSSGQAMPGLVVETLIPGYLGRMLAQLPAGVVIITGTNGKTTTTKMVVEVLQALGKRVLTNATGSNLTRGIISSVSQQATKTGKLPFDLAVFELDEAYARQFTDVVKPGWVLALNASRDQLDRFGEVDMVARLIAQTMLSATQGIVVNADDKRLSVAAAAASQPVVYFGVASELLPYFPRDDELVSVTGAISSSGHISPLAVELLSFKDATAEYKIAGVTYVAHLQVTGQHNFQNAAGALALLRSLLPNIPVERLVAALAHVQPAFGRGQEFVLKDDSHLQLNLVKNPASFRQGLASYVRSGTKTLIAINDSVADSRDMSWLWDIDFTPLQGLSLQTTGVRAVDMALRLSYDEIHVESIQPNIERALLDFCAQPGDKVIFASYTAMLKLHDLLKRTAGKAL